MSPSARRVHNVSNAASDINAKVEADQIIGKNRDVEMSQGYRNCSTFFSLPGPNAPFKRLSSYDIFGLNVMKHEIPCLLAHEVQILDFAVKFAMPWTAAFSTILDAALRFADAHITLNMKVYGSMLLSL